MTFLALVVTAISDPNQERPAYWAANPGTIAFLDGDLVRRIYDIQPDGTVGPNNLIAQD